MSKLQALVNFGIFLLAVYLALYVLMWGVAMLEGLTLVLG